MKAKTEDKKPVYTGGIEDKIFDKTKIKSKISLKQGSDRNTLDYKVMTNTNTNKSNNQLEFDKINNIKRVSKNSIDRNSKDNNTKSNKKEIESEDTNRQNDPSNNDISNSDIEGDRALIDEEEIMNEESSLKVVINKANCLNYNQSYIMSLLNKNNGNVNISNNSILDNIRSAVDKALEETSKDIKNKIESNAIKINSERKNISDVLKKFTNKKQKVVNINNEMRKQYIKETEKNMNDINYRIQKIDEKVFLLENSEFNSKSNVQIDPSLDKLNMLNIDGGKDLVKEHIEKETIKNELSYLKSLDSNCSYQAVKTELKNLKTQKVQLTNKLNALITYHNNLKVEYELKDTTVPREHGFNVKQFLENFDKDTEKAQKKIRLLNDNRKEFLDKLNDLKEREQERKQVHEEELKEKEEEKKKLKEEEYKQNLEKLKDKTEKKRNDIEINKEIFKQKPLENKYLYEEIEEKQNQKEKDEEEKKKIELFKVKHEMKTKFQRVTREHIEEFNKLIDDKLLLIQEKKEQLKEKQYQEEKEKTELFKSKLKAVKGSAYCFAKEEEEQKENERMSKLLEKEKRKENLSHLLNHLPIIKQSLLKKKELNERIQTIHSVSLLKMNPQQRELYKRHSKSRVSLRNSRSPLTLRMKSSEKIRQLNSSLINRTNKSVDNKNFKSGNLISINKNINKFISSGKIDSKISTFVTNSITNELNKKYLNRRKDLIATTQSDAFSDISSIKNMVNPLKTKRYENNIMNTKSNKTAGVNSTKSIRTDLNPKSTNFSTQINNSKLPSINTSNMFKNINNFNNCENKLNFENYSHINNTSSINDTINETNIKNQGRKTKKSKHSEKNQLENKLKNFDIQKLKGEALDKQCRNKEQIAKLISNNNSNKKECNEEICKTQEDLANAIINNLKYKLDVWKCYNQGISNDGISHENNTLNSLNNNLNEKEKNNIINEQ